MSTVIKTYTQYLVIDRGAFHYFKTRALALAFIRGAL